MKIILIGYMGSGKTTLGKALAKAKNIPFTDLDDYIAQRENASVQEIFNTKGEVYFRKKEAQYLKELLESDTEGVLALGGGTPCYGENMTLIQQSGSISVYLKYHHLTLSERLAKDKQRPLLKNIREEELEDFIRKHLFERAPFYLQANFTLPMDGLTLSESLEKLLQKIK
ncbi:MAG: shikimate kinase [Capnocytophaga sp.]|uniref:shikimate kinase n=1 Tax=Capnocytophaga sp. TaxID=44737 RepID=UPI003F9F4BA4